MNGDRGVVLALSAGGARGLAHIGVLKVLERHRIPVVGIVGTSMGGLLGALYCAGYSAQGLEQLALKVRRGHWLDFSVSRLGLFSGRKVEGLLRLLTGARTFAHCRPPLAVVAVDLERGRPVVIREGNLAEGVRATIAIPGLFSPVVREGQLLIDGGVLQRVPVDVARAEFPGHPVVAVDVGIQLAPHIGSVFDVLFQAFDIQALELKRHVPVRAEAVIEPAVGHWRQADMSRAREFIAAGEAAAEARLPHLLRLAGREEGARWDPGGDGR
ncbi:Serine protease [Candidatus Hydrogenisulfobacillus filiaventi]|uniref:Serine protease n=1 Tax=Candidatus Hydrogenisulfobacillus filiaventi TaxID=2707344 RepID=A0A6F8ZHJ4_9FIRM|nr:patatin-like phospholipase family protein [Bacillota bacterium]CAB1129122.1 Serine protease [Candidatus Hydrogenisulfobacillus filiaventi]